MAFILRIGANFQALFLLVTTRYDLNFLGQSRLPQELPRYSNGREGGLKIRTVSVQIRLEAHDTS